MSYYDYQTTARYIQCEHALQEIKRYSFGMGEKFLVLTACGISTEHIVAAIKESFTASMKEQLMTALAERNPRYGRQIAEAARFDALQKSKYQLEFIDMEGKEVTEKSLSKLAEFAIRGDFDVVVGVGGGKGLDFARGVSYYTNIKCILVPTSASTNAAATQLCIINDEKGTEQKECLVMANYPSLVLADTAIISKMPARSFAAGIADQLGSYYECLYSARRLSAVEEHSDLCWSVVENSISLLLRIGKKAVEAARKQQIDHWYETVLSMILHNNGLARSVSGSGFAHLLCKVLVKFPQCRSKIPHGLQVGYGIIPMMIAEKEPEAKIRAYLGFCRDIEVPMNLEMLGLGNIPLNDLKEACREVCRKPSAEVPFTEMDLLNSILKGEELVKTFLEETNDEKS